MLLRRLKQFNLCLAKLRTLKHCKRLAGLDLVVRVGSEAFEYDLHVAPGVDLQALVLEVEGASGLSVEGGRLLMQTAAGPFEQRIGAAWQVEVIYVLRNAYIWLALSAILGWGRVLLDRPFRWLPWANEAVYPWYVLHQSLIVLIAYWILPWQLGPVSEPLVVVVGTVLGCWALHEVIRRVPLLRPCFGLKMRPRDTVKAVVPVQLQAANDLA